jgi:HSP20 family protein
VLRSVYAAPSERSPDEEETVMATENPAGAVNEQPKKGEAQQEAKGSQRERSKGSQREGREPSGGLSRRESYAPAFLGPSFLGASPFSLMRRMMEDLDRMFEEFGSTRGFATTGGRELLSRAPHGESLWVPQVDVVEREGNLLVRADLPGLSKDDLHVEVTDDALILEGERRHEREEEGRGLYRQERSYGSFRRVIALPEGVNPEGAEAHFDNGVLEISLPLSREQARGRRIEIQEGKQATSVH